MASPVPDISPRHRFEARVSISVQRGEQKLNLQGWVRDLSESGLRAFVADALLPNESVTFELALSDTGNQAIPATVMRALGTDYGFQFTALSAEQRHQIRAKLSELPSFQDRKVELSGHSRKSSFRPRFRLADVSNNLKDKSRTRLLICRHCEAKREP